MITLQFQQYSKSKKFTLIICSIVILAACSAGVYLWLHRGPIVSYKAAAHEQFVRTSIKDNWFWVIADGFDHFSIDDMLARMAPPYPGSRYEGKLRIKVYIDEHNQPQGFVSYYMEKFYEGRIQFLIVHQAARSKGYGKALLTYAVQDLFNQGAESVVLMTRLINPARKLYESLGFTESSHGEKYINYRITRETFQKPALSFIHEQQAV